MLYFLLNNGCLDHAWLKLQSRMTLIGSCMAPRHTRPVAQAKPN